MRRRALLHTVQAAAVAWIPAAARGQSSAQGATFDTPQSVLIDEPFDAVLRGLPAGATVTITARTTVEREGILSQKEWSASATFIADDSGRVSLAEQSPVDGAYDGVDPMGLLLSMTTDDPIRGFPMQDHRLTLLASHDGGVVARTQITRRLAVDGVTERGLEADDIVGRLYTPPGTDPAPAIILTHGSLPYMPTEAAKLLASRGFTTLALQYYGDPEPVPADFGEIPIEYFQHAVDALLDQERTRGDEVGFWGPSKGGELALVLASHETRIGAVVPEVPSDLVWQGFPGNWQHLDWEEGRLDTSSWAVDGDPLPYIEYATTDEIEDAVGEEFTSREGYVVSEDLANQADLERARIAVEGIDAPVLLISGMADSLWHSTAMADRMVDRLEAAKFPHEYGHLAYEEAGHWIRTPYVPVDGIIDSDTANGETNDGNAEASRDHWPRLRSFFAEHLEGGVEPGTVAGSITPITDSFFERNRAPLVGAGTLVSAVGLATIAYRIRSGGPEPMADREITSDLKRRDLLEGRDPVNTLEWIVQVANRRETYAALIVVLFALAGLGLVLESSGLALAVLFGTSLFLVQGFLRFVWPHVESFYDRRRPAERDPESLRFQGFSTDVMVDLTLLALFVLGLLGLIALEVRLS